MFRLVLDSEFLLRVIQSFFQSTAPIFACAHLILDGNEEEGRMSAVVHSTSSDLLQVWHAYALGKLY